MSNYNSIRENNFRIIIISDTHGYLNPNIFNLVRENDYVIHAGDIMDENIIDSLKAMSKKTYAVNGNNDNFSSINDVETIETKLGKIIVTHGHNNYPNYHDSLRKEFPDAFLVIYGHTHKHIVDTSSMPYIVNPGASGKIRTQGGSSCLLFESIDRTFSIKLKKFFNDD